MLIANNDGMCLEMLFTGFCNNKINDIWKRNSSLLGFLALFLLQGNGNYAQGSARDLLFRIPEQRLCRVCTA